MEADGQILKIKTEKPVAVLVQTLAEPLFLIVDTTVNTDEFASKRSYLYRSLHCSRI